jgi:hypothetical protein
MKIRIGEDDQPEISSTAREKHIGNKQAGKQASRQAGVL